MKKRKILFIGSNPKLSGGISTWTREMMNCSSEKYSFKYIDASFGKNGRPRNSLVLMVKNYIRNFTIIIKLFTYLFVFRPTIVHSSTTASPNALTREILCAKVAYFFKAKYVVHFHCTIDEFLGGEKGENRLRRLVKLTSAFFCLNQASYNTMRSMMSDKNEKYIFLLPNFVDEKDIIDSKDVSEIVRSVIFVSRIQKKKGYFEFIELAKKFTEITFNIVGPNLDNIDMSNLPNNVIYYGEKSKFEITELLDSSDIFVFLTHYMEGFSMVLLEAMSRGLPIICSNTPSIHEMIEDNGGILVNYSNIDEVTTKFTDLLQNFPLRLNMSKNNISKVSLKYSKKVVISQLLDSYDLILSK